MSNALDSRDNTYVAIETIYSYLLKAFNKMTDGDDDKALEEAMDKADGKVNDMMSKFEESGVDISDEEWESIRDRMKADFIERAKRELSTTDPLESVMHKADELIKKLTGEDYSSKGHLDDKLIKDIKDLEDSDYSEYDMDKGLAISSSQRKITWQKAKSDTYYADRYKESKQRVKKQISKLKKKIQLYGNSEKFVIRNQKRGKIDKRMLHRIPSGRMDLFKAEITKEDKPLDICLLVDESGSMGSYTMGKARECAISIKEALADNDRLNLWVFGHSADENQRGTTDMIEYWSPSMQDRPMAMGGMRARYENRDGNAIIASAERVRSESYQPKAKKLMIVLSDGAPSADMYRGYQAEKHTRKCVKNVESKGWDIIQVGFAGSRASNMANMFSNWIYVDDTDKIGDKVSKIIRKVLKI
jgi:nitric oxide reductase activation protein